jgi:hypothetical protein
MGWTWLFITNSDGLMELIVEHVGNEWRCDLHDGAGTVLVTRSKQELEEALDWLEATGRLGKDVERARFI